MTFSAGILTAFLAVTFLNELFTSPSIRNAKNGASAFGCIIGLFLRYGIIFTCLITGNFYK